MPTSAAWRLLMDGHPNRTHSRSVYILVGLPGCGKSTWVQNYFTEAVPVISTDWIMEMIADKYGMTYNDVFGDFTYNFAERMMHKIARQLVERGDRTVVWDQTNLTVSSRAKKLAMFPGYSKVAVIVHPPEDHAARLASRVGKHIPERVLASMASKYQKPSFAEGFDVILEVNGNQCTSNGG